MKQITYILFLILFLWLGKSSAQFAGHEAGIGIYYSYTTSSKLFYNPDSPDEIEKSSHRNLNEFLNPSIDIRYRISEHLLLGLCADYIKVTNPVLSYSVIPVPIEEGYTVIPLELSTYYVLPFSTENFFFHMGGGLGMYFGSLVREIGEARAANVSRDFAYGIQVSVGMDYLYKEMLSFRFEMRFRDPEFTIKSKYSQDTVQLNGRTYNLPESSFKSKINIDGITFTLGAVFHIF